MTLEERMEAARASLAAAAPARIVTRKWVPLANVPSEELDVGQFTLCSRGERGYQNFNDRKAMDGTHELALIGRIVLPEASDGQAVEQAEFAMVEQIKTWLRNLPETLCCLVATGFSQSGQLEAPHGWVLFALEVECE